MKDETDQRFKSQGEIVIVLIYAIICMEVLVLESDMARGVQYVHCVMHTCIMVKVGGNEMCVCKKHVNFKKSEGHLQKYWGKKNFPKYGKMN